MNKKQGKPLKMRLFFFLVTHIDGNSPECDFWRALLFLFLSVGLPPLYTLVAAMIGGELFGIMGIIFFIPLTAVVIELVKEDAAHRAKEKKESLERCSDNMYNKKIYKKTKKIIN